LCSASPVGGGLRWRSGSVARALRREAGERARVSASSIWFLVALAAVYHRRGNAPVRHFELVSIDDPIYVSDNPYLQEGVTWSAVRQRSLPPTRTSGIPRPSVAHARRAPLRHEPGAMHVSNLLPASRQHPRAVPSARAHDGRSRRQCVSVAALFAVHPLHVESVAWVAERKDVLSTVFWMLALWSYAGYARKPTPARYGLVWSCSRLG